MRWGSVDWTIYSVDRPWPRCHYSAFAMCAVTRTAVYLAGPPQPTQTKFKISAMQNEVQRDQQTVEVLVAWPEQVGHEGWFTWRVAQAQPLVSKGVTRQKILLVPARLLYCS
eukprot:SAG31_NODE_22708_length_519_cov_1.619048_2_plen_112_part_00